MAISACNAASLRLSTGSNPVFGNEQAGDIVLYASQMAQRVLIGVVGSGVSTTSNSVLTVDTTSALVQGDLGAGTVTTNQVWSSGIHIGMGSSNPASSNQGGGGGGGSWPFADAIADATFASNAVVATASNAALSNAIVRPGALYAQRLCAWSPFAGPAGVDQLGFCFAVNSNQQLEIVKYAYLAGNATPVSQVVGTFGPANGDVFFAASNVQSNAAFLPLRV